MFLLLNASRVVPRIPSLQCSVMPPKSECNVTFHFPCYMSFLDWATLLSHRAVYMQTVLEMTRCGWRTMLSTSWQEATWHRMISTRTTLDAVLLCLARERKVCRWLQYVFPRVADLTVWRQDRYFQKIIFHFDGDLYRVVSLQRLPQPLPPYATDIVNMKNLCLWDRLDIQKTTHRYLFARGLRRLVRHNRLLAPKKRAKSLSSVAFPTA